MRIISKFHDYYDITMSHAHDDSIVYIREVEEKIYPEKLPFKSFNRRTNEFETILIRSHHIGFCGKVYPVLEFKVSRKKPDAEGYIVHNKFCYDIEDVDDFVKEFFNKEETENFNSDKKRLKWRYQFNGYLQTRSGAKKFFEDSANCSKEILDKMFEKNPIFVVESYGDWEDFYNYLMKRMVRRSEYKVSFNRSLKEFNFFRKFPPAQAFQELNMWLNNKAIPMKPIPEIPNDVKISNKGFDKFSFRSEKKK